MAASAVRRINTLTRISTSHLLKLPRFSNRQVTTMSIATTCPISGASLSTNKRVGSGCPMATMANMSISQPRTDPTLAIPEPYRHIKLTEDQKTMVKASVPVLQEHGITITKLFYDNMLAAHTELHDIFNRANQVHLEQPKALAMAVLAYAQNIDDLTPLGPAVELIAGKHVSMVVRPEQYAIVGKHLIGAIATVLGDACTPELADTWTRAYWMLAEILINREEQLYKAANGWTDWADFRVAKKVKESDEVTSFHLEPVDTSLRPLPSFLPGQYISIQTDVPALGTKQTRQYSLSDSHHTDHYRISVKVERGNNAVKPPTVPGLVSVIMHDDIKEGDTLSVSHPVGDFFLDPNQEADTPLVLISGGIGLTPLMSILNSLVTKQSNRPISWIHGARNNHVRAFGEHIQQVRTANNNVKVTLFNDHAGPDEVEGKDYDHAGFIDLSKLDEQKTLFLSNKKTQYWCVGPVPFMVGMERDLAAKGVPPIRIHVEKFGTGGVPAA